VSTAIHCDLTDCDTWVRVGPLDNDWITVTEGTTLVGHYCCGSHAVTAMFGMFEPPTTVDL